ncbi:hypothetical protein [Ectothiorhodospira shaposhnikovii]|uniref:hypothetical protein n=1 Tax=Ectothiorhodospira shaposhnikovii TaxID=1054 RepID=UPI0019072128|nr:hypothetical protein [Ectothiorhodospira shaposhnikovii]
MTNIKHVRDAAKVLDWRHGIKTIDVLYRFFAGVGRGAGVSDRLIVFIVPGGT